MQHCASLEFLESIKQKRTPPKKQNLRHENKQIDLLFEHIPRKILTFEADQSITWNHRFSGFLPKQVRALPAIIVISGCIIWEYLSFHRI